MYFMLFAVAALLYVLYFWLTMRPHNFPPGPPYLPLIGSLPFMREKLIHFTMTRWQRQYGDVVGLLLGSAPTIAIVGPETVLEVLRRDEFQGRPDTPSFRDRSFGELLGIFFSDGPFWVEQRRFTLRHLRDFGFGKTSMEGFILEEVRELIDEIRGQTVQVSGLFNLSTINVLWAIMAGSRLSRKDHKLQRLMDALTQAFRSGAPAGSTLLNVFPVLKKIAPELSGYAADQRFIHILQAFLRDEIHCHKETLDKDNPRDFMDVYITEMQKEKHVKSTFTEESLIVTCMDLFSAGGESVGNTLGFALLYMVLYPDIQHKVQKEIDAKVDRQCKPLLKDRSRLPFVEAVLTEVGRINTIAPMAPPHRVTCNTELNGYSIPKNTLVLPSIWCLLHDKNHWGDPDVFRPERFLDAEGNFAKDPWLIPFGLGKRMCLGEPLARNNLFIFFTSMLQEFSFSLPEGDPIPSTLSLPGFTTAPQPFRVCISQR